MLPQTISGQRDGSLRPRGTGIAWNACSLIISSVIGSGIVSLAWTIAQLGWIAGPLMLFLFASVSIFTSSLLSDGTADDVRNFTYMDAVRSILGDQSFKVCVLVQYLKLFGVANVYTIASSKSTMVIQKSFCFQSSDGKDTCSINPVPHSIWFGIVQIILFQFPDFNKLWWLPFILEVLSFTYSMIGIGLSIVEVAKQGNFMGSLKGITIGTVTESQKIWLIFQALGIISFAYSHPNILIEIQIKIKSSLSESKTMKKATLISYTFITTLYLLCGCFGYAAFGDSTPQNLLTGPGFHSPQWVADIANVAIVFHLILSYQAFCQSLVAFAEKLASEAYPDYNNFLTKEIGFKSIKLNPYKFVSRLVFVIITTLVSISLQSSFSSLVGLVGAFGFWPLTVYFPVQMYIAKKEIPKWCTKWVWLQSLSMGCLAISVVAAAGSISEFAHHLKSFKPFMIRY